MPITPADAPNHVTIYTDGSCLGNPGPGGWGALLIHGENRKELSQGYRRTTNNRMELLAVISALEALKRPCSATIFTDSKYVKDAIVKKWLDGWIKRGWMTAAKKPVKNPDLWKRLAKLLPEHRVEFRWVAGHSGQPENERCDELARKAASGPDKLEDSGYA